MSALNTYYYLRKKEDNGERPIYRPSTWNASKHHGNMNMKNTEWFRKNSGNHHTIYTFLQPETRHKWKALQVVKNKLDVNIWGSLDEPEHCLNDNYTIRSNSERGIAINKTDFMISQMGGKENIETEEIKYHIELLGTEKKWRKGSASATPQNQNRAGSVHWKHGHRKHGELIPRYLRT